MSDEYPFPETAAETRAVADLIWGDHPELITVGDVRKAMTEKLNAMRQEQAEFVATQNRNGEFFERYRRGVDTTHLSFDGAAGLADARGQALQASIKNLDAQLAARGIDQATQDEIMAAYAADPMGILAKALGLS